MIKLISAVVFVTVLLFALPKFANAQESKPEVTIVPGTQIVTAGIPITVSIEISGTTVLVPLVVGISTSVWIDSSYTVRAEVGEVTVQNVLEPVVETSALPRQVGGDSTYVPGVDIEYGMWRTSKDSKDCAVRLFDRDGELTDLDAFGTAVGKVYRLDESVYQINLSDCGNFTYFESLDGVRPANDPGVTAPSSTKGSDFDFREFTRNVEGYVGTEVTISGVVSQMTERVGSSITGAIALALGAEKAAGVLFADGDSENQVVFRIPEEHYSARILEDDEITITGIVQNPEVFERGLTNQEVLLPVIQVFEYEVHE